MTNPTLHGQVPEALRLADEWQRKTQREADRRNSAYDHYGMGNTPETVDPLGYKMAAELCRQHTHIAELEAQLDECFPGEPKVAVPQGLISAACFAIRNKRDGGKVLEQLRRYSVGDRSQPLAPQQAAPKAAPAWEHHARKLTQWLHCMSHNDSYFGEPAGLVKQVTGELNRLIGEAPRQEAQEPEDSDGFGSAAHWKEKAQYWAGVAHRLRGEALRGEPVDGIVHPLAPQQEAQEPVAIKAMGYGGSTGINDYLMSDGTIKAMRPGEVVWPDTAPLSNDVFQKTWALLDELERLRSVDREDEDWVTLNTRDDELRAALRASRWWELCAK